MTKKYRKMKKITWILIFLLATTFGFAQEYYSFPHKNQKISKIDSIYILYPELLAHKIQGGDYRDTKLMYETFELHERVLDYQYKQIRDLLIGGGLMGVGGLGWWYTLGYMDQPIYIEGDDAANAEADRDKRARRIVGWTSTGIFLAGATVFTVSFKNYRRMKAEIGLNTLKLEYRLFGERRYYKGKHPRELKNTKSLKYYQYH